MNKAKKSLLLAGSILTIVASAFAIIMSMVLFLAGGMFDEEMLKESYKNDSEYTYFEDANGDYYFTTIEDGVELIIEEDEIEMLAEVVSMLFTVCGVVTLGFGIAKLVLAIRLLIMNNRDKYAKGNVIALLVLSILNFNVAETVLFIIALCQKHEAQNIDQNEHKNELANTDVTLKDVE